MRTTTHLSTDIKQRYWPSQRSRNIKVSLHISISSLVTQFFLLNSKSVMDLLLGKKTVDLNIFKNFDILKCITASLLKKKLLDGLRFIPCLFLSLSALSGWLSFSLYLEEERGLQ